MPTGPAAAAPFTTTATGVATGLNADKVDGKDATDLHAKFADVSAAGALNAGRGAKTASVAASVYSVDFDSDVNKCVRTATITGTDPGEVTTTLTDNDTVAVHTFNSAGTPADRSFHLVVTC